MHVSGLHGDHALIDLVGAEPRNTPEHQDNTRTNPYFLPRFHCFTFGLAPQGDSITMT